MDTIFKGLNVQKSWFFICFYNKDLIIFEKKIKDLKKVREGP